jgi:hypothetical protein
VGLLSCLSVCLSVGVLLSLGVNEHNFEYKTVYYLLQKYVTRRTHTSKQLLPELILQAFNLLKPNANYMSQESQQSVTQHLVFVCEDNVTFSGFSIHDGTLLHSKSQYTTVKHSRKLLEHTYTSDPHGLGRLTPIEFSQQDLLWQSSNTHSHSCSHKAFKHTSGKSIVGLSVHLHTTTALRRIVHH